MNIKSINENIQKYSFTNILTYLLTLLFLLIPFNHEWQIMGAWVTLADCLVIVIFSLWVIKLSKSNGFEKNTKRLFFLILGFLSIVLMSAAFGVNVYQSIKEFLKFLFIFILTAVLVTEDGEYFKKLIPYVLIITVSITSLWFIYDIYFSTNVSISNREWLRFYGSYNQLNALGTYLAICIPFSIWLFWKIRNIFLKSTFSFVIIAQISAVILTFSRSSILALIVSLIMLFLIANKPFKKIQLVMLICAGILLSQLAVPGIDILGRVQTITNTKEPSNEVRIEYAKLALKITKEHPLLGVGIGNYKQAALLLPHKTENIYEMTHNISLQISAESGIPALFAFYILVFYVLFYYRKAIIEVTDSDTKLLIICALTSYVGLLINSQFGDPFVRNLKEYFALLSAFPFIYYKNKGC